MKSSVGLAKNLLMSPRKSRKELIMKKWPGHFYYWKVPSDQKKYRRTRKELTNESEKIAKSLKWSDTFIVKKYRRTQKK